MWCDMVKNDNVDKVEDCDVSNEVIDFSLKDHVADAFSDFTADYENEFAQKVKRNIFKYIAWTSGGLVVATSLAIISLSFSIKYIGADENIQSFIKPRIQQILNVNDIKITSGNLNFRNFKPHISLRGVNMNGLEVPEMKITPAIFKSIFSFKFQIGGIELINTNVDLAVSNKTENVFIKNYFSKDKDTKYIPIDLINNAFADDIECKLTKSNIKIRRGNESLLLDNVSGVFSGKKLIPDRMYRIEEAGIDIYLAVEQLKGKWQEIPQNTCVKWFDYDKIYKSICVRNRKNGDFFQVNAAGGTKKLKDYFIDKKIPRKERDEKILLADGSHIIWIFGDRISEKYKVTETTQNILKITITEVKKDGR